MLPAFLLSKLRLMWPLKVMSIAHAAESSKPDLNRSR
jgi:hypothetical protein